MRKAKRIKMQTEDKHGRSSGMTRWHGAGCSVNKTTGVPGGGYLTLREPRSVMGRDAMHPGHQRTAWTEQVLGNASLLPPFPVATVHKPPRTMIEIFLPSRKRRLFFSSFWGSRCGYLRMGNADRPELTETEIETKEQNTQLKNADLSWI